MTPPVPPQDNGRTLESLVAFAAGVAAALVVTAPSKILWVAGLELGASAALCLVWAALFIKRVA